MMENHDEDNTIWRDRLDRIVYIPENETDELFGTIYISPCQKKISNDPFEDADPLEDLSPCNRTSYECPKETTEISEITDGKIVLTKPLELVINFDFEMHYDEDADLDETMNDLEGSYLQHLAALTGMLNCEITSAEVRNSGNRRLKAFLTEEEQDALIGITSDPEDTPDPLNSECIVPVQSSVMTGTNCAPVNGAITLVVEPDLSAEAADGINRGILKTVRQGMLNDVYTSRDIRKVSFIGTRLETINGAQGAPTIRATGNSNAPRLTSIGIGFIIAGAVVAVLLIALLVRRKRGRTQEREEMMRDVIFYDATVEAKEIAASQPSDRDDDADDNDSTTGSVMGTNELALQPDPIVEAEKLSLPAGDSAGSSEIPTGSEPVQIADYNVGSPIKYSPSREPLLPGGTSDPDVVIDDLDDDDRSDIESIDGIDGGSLEDDDRSDIDSIDSESETASFTSIPSASNSAGLIPYVPLASESNEEPEGSNEPEPEVTIDRLNIISETDENMLSEDNGTEDGVVPTSEIV